MAYGDNTQMTQASNNLKVMKKLLSEESLKKRVDSVLGNQSGAFLASVLDLYSGSTNLRNCDANKVMAECMKAAALKLPVTQSLGFCYVIPYGNVPQFQLGYKGIIQLAQRSGQYKYINADAVYEGETVNYNRISGMLEISGDAISENVIGYFAYFQLINGFEKAVYWSREKVIAHASKFSSAYKAKKKDSPWFTQFDAMAIKTVLKHLISKYGIMSIEFANQIADDNIADQVKAEVEANANGEPLTIPDDGQTVEVKPEDVRIAEAIEVQDSGQANNSLKRAGQQISMMDAVPPHDPDPGF